MRIIDKSKWKRHQLFEHFKTFVDPYFAVTLPFDVSKAYAFSKKNEISFFGRYLHDCMKAINEVENLRYRIIDGKPVVYDVIHASATIPRDDHSFGFSFIEFDNDLDVFINNLERETKRIQKTQDLFPPDNNIDCIYCSALPWVAFSGHKEPVSSVPNSVPQLAFGKVKDGRMNVAISVNHALADGYHVGLFAEKFQFYLNN